MHLPLALNALSQCQITNFSLLYFPTNDCPFLLPYSIPFPFLLSTLRLFYALFVVVEDQIFISMSNIILYLLLFASQISTLTATFFSLSSIITLFKFILLSFGSLFFVVSPVMCGDVLLASAFLICSNRGDVLLAAAFSTIVQFL